ncbi:hypothetical protein PsorP6_005765 [Peronosclerospora sorghi]|uniref:Uncharacterized protein n=1 Tax=Peronosclerospora sorghi TaxID=230839 RepID=A0ACC0W577_9STRA|nr:hypothetical protein PsorP6_005765 [Peronosclerospora sorghi]
MFGHNISNISSTAMGIMNCSAHTTITSPKSFETTAPGARSAIELVLQKFADRESFELLSAARYLEKENKTTRIDLSISNNRRRDT